MKGASQTWDEEVHLAAFMVGDEEYVLDIMRVREIVRGVEIVAIHKGPKYVRGVIHLRGEIVPYIDLRDRLGLPQAELPHRAILLVMLEGRAVGLGVDEVREVVRVPRSELIPAPELLDARAAPLFVGACRYDDRLLILLNAYAVVDSEEPGSSWDPQAWLEGTTHAS